MKSCQFVLYFSRHTVQGTFKSVIFILSFRKQINYQVLYSQVNKFFEGNATSMSEKSIEVTVTMQS